jgi:hypothetical protein
VPSQPLEPLEEDLRHIVQYVRLARAPRVEPEETDEYLTEIEHRAAAALTKLPPRAAPAPVRDGIAPPSAPMPEAYLAGDEGTKLMRYYWCLGCGRHHWEDERTRFDEHILYCGAIEYGHRTIELVK